MIQIKQGNWKRFKPYRHILCNLVVKDSPCGLRTFTKEVGEMDTEDYKIFVLFDDGKPVAWAAAVWSAPHREFDLQLNVKKAYRRRRYGTELFKRAERWIKAQGYEFTYFPDPNNNEFFKTVGSQ